VNAGEIVAITGESGSGKSMTALAAIGLCPDKTMATGRIMLDGTDILTSPEPALCAIRGNDIGMVFQEPMTALNPVQPIGMQVAETIRIHQSIPKAEALRRAAAMLERVGLPPDRFPLNRYPHQLSGGQRQRVVIAMAIALRPKLLIADEPTTALDVTTQAHILALLKGLTQEFGMGLLLISHDLAVVADVADRIVVMQRGRVVESGPTLEVLRDQTHPYTQALFAASNHQVNLPVPPAPEPLLRVQNVSRSYAQPRRSLFGPRGQTLAVRDVSFTLNHGERLGLVGESG
jgi:peptide/nickel transport system ATP-binding protein